MPDGGAPQRVVMQSYAVTNYEARFFDIYGVAPLPLSEAHRVGHEHRVEPHVPALHRVGGVGGAVGGDVVHLAAARGREGKQGEQGRHDGHAAKGCEGEPP